MCVSWCVRDFRLALRLISLIRRDETDTRESGSALFLHSALSLNLRDDFCSQHRSAHFQPFCWRRLGLKTGDECLEFWSLARRLMHWNIVESRWRVWCEHFDWLLLFQSVICVR